MRHARFDIATLTIDGVAVPLKAAYLLVVDADDSDVLQWECLAYALDPAPLEQQVHPVAVTTLDGRTLHGDAAVVRSVEGSHVLRGTGVLHGVEPDDLDRG